MREAEEERRIREMSAKTVKEQENNKNKGKSGKEGEDSDISPKEPETESVIEHKVNRSTMQEIRESLVKTNESG